MWHNLGKVNVTKGSDVVTGVGTKWVENVRVGDAFQGPDGKLYQVINVASNEALAISPAYEGNTATNLNYWVVPVPGYSKTQADRLSLIISRLDGDIVTATEAANQAKEAATQAQQWKVEAAASAAAAQSSELSAAQSADRAEQARDDAVVVVTDGQGSLTPAPGKFPVAGTSGTIKQDWIENLQFELDALRVARNKLMYGDGPYPVLDLQFQGAKILDPRIAFSRATPDWDEYGNRYEVNEPVLTDKGLWVSGARTNLISHSNINATNWETTNGASLGEAVKISDSLSLTTIKSAGTSQYAAVAIDEPLAAAQDAVYTFSAFFRRGESDAIAFRIGGVTGADFSVALRGIASGAFQFTPARESEATFTYVSGAVEPTYGDVYRVSITFSVKQGLSIYTFVNIHWDGAIESDDVISLGGFMLEEQKYVTPLIPTNGSQVTVAYSPAHIVGDLFNDVYNPKQGTIYWEGLFKGGIDILGYYYFFSLRGEGSTALSVRIRAPDLILQLLQDTTATNSGEEVLLGDKLRFALAYDSKTFILYMNGVRQISGPLIEGNTSLFNRFQLGSYGLGGITPLHNYSFKYYNKSLPETTLQELTQ